MVFSAKNTAVFVTALLLSFLSASALVSQPVQVKEIRGVVLDKDTGEPIPTVHVYISQTTVGTTTKHDGTFQFTTNLQGVHQLIFSYVGYKTEIKDVNFYTSGKPYFEVRLTPDPIELEPLEVTASNREWQENFKIFKRQFIGTTTAANETEIENPWVVNFERDQDGTLIAHANHPLLISNRAFGYQLKVDLVEFKWPKNNRGHYLFYSSYNQLVAKNDQEKRKWERNRRNHYKGSFEHFLKSLYDDDLKGNDFETVMANSDNSVRITKMDPLPAGSLHLLTGISGLNPDQVQAYRLGAPVDVLYGKKRFNRSRNRARSRIVPVGRSRILVVINQARLANPLSISVEGVWAGHRIANLLPADYTPDN